MVEVVEVIYYITPYMSLGGYTIMDLIPVRMISL